MEARGKRNKRNARALPMGDVQPADLAGEPTVLFVVATAGQGELPSNAKEFWKTIQKLSINDLNLEKMSFSVFGLGDSHYWPPPGGMQIFL
jgi:sulfite reductase (NADPH) hemoprotein beta-component